MTYGLLLAGGGLIFLGTQLQVDTSYWLMLPVFVIMGHGMASVMAPMTAAVMNSVGPQRAGLGSAMSNTSREVGGVFGIALLGTILTTKLKSSLHRVLVGLGLTSTQQTRDRHRGRSRNPRPDGPHELGLSADAERLGHQRVRQRVHGRLPRGAARRRDCPVGRGRRRLPVHPRPAHRARSGAGRTRSGGRRGVAAVRLPIWGSRLDLSGPKDDGAAPPPGDGVRPENEEARHGRQRRDTFGSRTSRTPAS